MLNNFYSKKKNNTLIKYVFFADLLKLKLILVGISNIINNTYLTYWEHLLVNWLLKNSIYTKLSLQTSLNKKNNKIYTINSLLILNTFLLYI